MSDYEVISEVFTISKNSTRSDLAVSCGSKRALSGGIGYNPSVELRSSAPSVNGNRATGWQIAGKNSNPNSDTQVTVFAICANVLEN
jgi:hypothetical protein